MTWCAAAGIAGVTIEAVGKPHSQRRKDAAQKAAEEEADDLAARAVEVAVDVYLDYLESVLMALHQRELNGMQCDRYARLLNYAEQDALARLRP